MADGCDQVEPSKVTALLFSSTAAQKYGDGQETDVRPPPDGSTACGADQAVPFHDMTLPISSTARQWVAVGHEMDAKRPVAVTWEGGSQEEFEAAVRGEAVAAGADARGVRE